MKESMLSEALETEESHELGVGGCQFCSKEERELSYERMKHLAQRLLKNGVDAVFVLELTGLSISDLKSLDLQPVVSDN